MSISGRSQKPPMAKGKDAKHMVIFEASKPLLTDPHRIYPGQVLRIPELD